MYQHLPKVVLHEHLDGGLRAATILELAEQAGYRDLPATDPEALANWFDQGQSGSLERYLEAFSHTVAVMQTPEAIERVAFEAVEDLAADGVVYAEIRFAPSLLLDGGLDRHAVIEAALQGLRRGEQATGITARLIVDALRHLTDSELAARVAIDFADAGVVGFDLAGPEDGFPPDDHLVACRMIREANLGLTLHAGEAFGPDSIWRALQRCGAHRIGHGVHIVDDCVVVDGDIVELGKVAAYVLDFQVPLEVCPTSNLHTSHWTVDEHPLGMLHRAGFNISLSPDNRLMSRVQVSDEFALAVEHHGFTQHDLHAMTRRAMQASFADHRTKQRILADIDAGYSAILA